MTSDDGPDITSDEFWAYMRATGDFDDEFLDRMDAARAETKLNEEVANRRPSLADLGKLLESHVQLLPPLVLLRRLEVLAELEQRGEAPDLLDDGAWVPSPGGLAVTDREELARVWDASLIRDDDHDDFSRVVRTARRLFEAAVDHLHAIAVLVQDGSTVRAPLALTRVALDAAAHLHHLLDPEIPASQRLVRALNEDLVVLSESVREAERSGLSRPTDEEVAIDSLLAEVKRAVPAIHASWPASQRPAGSKLGRVPYVDKFVGPSEMVDVALEVAGGTMWAGLSAVVHNQESQTFRVMFSLELSKNVRYREMNIALPVLAAAVVLDRAIRRLGTYMGWDVTDGADDELLRVWSIGAGLADEQIREQVLRERAGP